MNLLNLFREVSTVRKFAYAGTALGLSASLGANVLDVLGRPDWTGPAILGAFVWSLMLFISTEVLVRKRWPNRFAQVVGALIVASVAVMAATISYEHVHSVMLHQWDASPLSAMLGPLVIDLGMLVCALVLAVPDADPDTPAAAPSQCRHWFTRRRRVQTQPPAPAPVAAPVLVPELQSSAPVAALVDAPVTVRATASTGKRAPRRTVEELVQQVQDERLDTSSARKLMTALRCGQTLAAKVHRQVRPDLYPDQSGPLGVAVDGRA